MASVAAGPAFSQTTGVVCEEFDQIQLTHVLTPTGPLPTALDPNGVSPYMSYSETSNRPVPKRYRMISLENEKVKAIICPDLCGKVISLTHKESGKEVLYRPDVIKYTRILPRFYFVAGGIEVSFPISHSPTQNEPVLYQIDHTGDRTYVTCGERESHYGMQWSVEYSLGDKDECLTQRVVYYNPGKQAYPWMSWSNAALPCAPDTQYDFPNGTVLSHASTLDTIDWKTEGTHHERDIKEMTGYFWKTKDVNTFGAYTPSLGSGLYHIADESSTPGIKLWSYGVAGGMVHAQYPRPAALRRNPRWPDQRPVHQARIASRREKESRRILDTDRSSFGYLFLKGSGIKASPDRSHPAIRLGPEE